MSAEVVTLSAKFEEIQKNSSKKTKPGILSAKFEEIQKNISENPLKYPRTGRRYQIKSR